MTNKYQKTMPKTSTGPGLAVPDEVTIAMGEIPSRMSSAAESWYWALTPLSAARLFGDVFGPNNVEVRAFGNVLTSVAFLEGMAAEELSRKVLDARDPQFPMLVTVRAYRPVTCES